MAEGPSAPLEADLLRLAVRAARVAAWHLDLESGRLTTSEEFGEVFGSAAGTGLHYSEQLKQLAEPQQSLFRMIVERCAQSGEPFDFTTVVPSEDGHDRQIRNVGGPVRGVERRITGVQGAVHDVTEVVERQDDRARMDKHVQSRLDQMATGIMFLDRSWRFTYVNETGQRYIQNPSAVLLGHSIWELYPDVEEGPFGAVYHHAMATREVATTRAYYPPLRTWFAVTAYPIEDGLAVHLQDVTEDQQIRLQLEESSERIRAQAALLDAAHDAMTVRSLDSRVLYWNAGAERMFGWSAEEAVGSSARDLIAADASAFDDAVAEVARTGHWMGELVARAPDGRTLVADCRWQLLQHSPETSPVVFAVESDITEYRRAEEERYRDQRMESLGTLAGGIAHDLNNVLTPMLLAAQLLAEVEPDSQRSVLLRSIEAGAQRGADLIRQVLAFARGEEGHRRVLDVNEVLAELSAFCRTTVAKTIDVAISTSPEPAHVLADRTQLLQVLVNLVTNACDAMPAGGRLSITAEMQPEDPAEVVVTVADTGTGMEADTRARVFEPFFTTKSTGRGTGLGLSTSIAIVRRHGGSLHVESEPGAGSTFLLRLPAVPGVPVPDIPETETAGATGDGELLLLADDEESVRGALRTLLERRGYRVVEAGDGRQAMAVAAEQERQSDPVALAILDVMMPVLDGAGAADGLLRRHPGLPIVTITGFDPDGEGEARAARGAVRLLRKPFTAEDLLAAVRESLAAVEPPAPVLS